NRSRAMGLRARTTPAFAPGMAAHGLEHRTVAFGGRKCSVQIDWEIANTFELVDLLAAVHAHDNLVAVDPRRICAKPQARIDRTASGPQVVVPFVPGAAHVGRGFAENERIRTFHEWRH